jgi:DNA (cytosine-5)-methyltransferase 1
MKEKSAPLRLVAARKKRLPGEKAESACLPLSTIDLFCGAGGITEGFREAGYSCLYGNDCMAEAVETFSFNHPEAWGDARDIEEVDPAQVRNRLGLKQGTLDVLVGGPPCQGFSINAPS